MMRDHDHQPQMGTIVRAKDGIPADLFAPADYPLAAVCMLCDVPIVTQTFLSERWTVNGGSPS